MKEKLLVLVFMAAIFCCCNSNDPTKNVASVINRSTDNVTIYFDGVEVAYVLASYNTTINLTGWYDRPICIESKSDFSGRNATIPSYTFRRSKEHKILITNTQFQVESY